MSDRPSQTLGSAPLEPLPLFERLRFALLEDHGPVEAGDVTSLALVAPERTARAVVLAKADGVLCGVALLSQVFRMAEELVLPAAQDRADLLFAAGEEARAGRRGVEEVLQLSARSEREGSSVKVLRKDGARVAPGTEVAEIAGNARALLFGERTALNLLCRLSGIATQTARYVEAVAGTRARIVDTRKTTPLWRDLEKYAVKCGGGENHRRGLYDMVLIKDNHLALWGANDPAEAVRAAQARFPKLAVEVEVTGLPGLARVCRAGAPRYILLDNFEPAKTREAVAWCDEYYRARAGRPLLESSGGITFENVRAFAEAGVDRISIGALTHSVRALDFSLEFGAAPVTSEPRP